MINVCTNIIGYFGIGKRVNSNGWWCVVRMVATPLETCLLWYVWFRVDSDRIRPPYFNLVLV